LHGLIEAVILEGWAAIGLRWKRRKEEMVKGKWVKVDGEFMFECRLAKEPRNPAEHVGANAEVWSKAKNFEIVTLTEMVKDYGKGDVTLYRVTR
jgi:hypothetical protein